MDSIVMICAVELEANPILSRVDRLERFVVGRRVAYRGRLADREVVVVPGGMGKTNASQALTAVLERHEPAGVLGFGVGGAYVGAGPRVGDIVVATDQFYGDEGVSAPDGWISCEGIGIPLLEVGEVRYFNHFPLDESDVRAATAVLDGCTAGPFVTVSSCSGTTDGGAALARRFSAICETMEGAAFAHVSALYGVPYLEIRGISNLVEDRDRSRWRLAEAAAAAGDAAVSLAEAWNPSRTTTPDTERNP